MDIALEEQIINETLPRLLMIHLSEMHYAWSPLRSPFNKASFGNMVILTDGCLETGAFPEKFAIIEVKALSRGRDKKPELLWQEIAEMVT
ncbi:hypothetical protein DTO013E5_5676 [Penicillium roqueforti]|uniref:Genomic scaffold, ProqFM164S02 n=1 Tax=Penicillium roqueforti (strain FM164) TaxID=1365484 RepID=W6Q9Q5_PENRF|nr:uncharacterized protein LCP9604111_9497 [Penicillium roqueforti]CDM33140.1 unnamed protein product [Penicillium roqueforti FM164]KAF9238293.1 hypothetical protein LCP9604111_9497 [Penicillium roqueforti]KAI1830834.1 hypothetical protein CBS147337_8451 [Penicillium roqueforti]KAI2674420.1 hypothetical protein CBS147355_7034 [Penicillium roqueforti]KAI2683922.1 hypothetical protein LCP963914a_5752 [Penicillium roqueforti]